MGCIKFNGSTSKLVTPIGSIPIGNEPRTIEFSFKLDGDNDNTCLFSYGSRDSGKVLLIYAFSNNSIWFETGSGSCKYVTEKAFNDNQWHNVALIFDGGHMVQYIDTEKVQDISTTLSTNNTYDLHLGCYFSSSGGVWFFKGYMDDIRIWNRALTENEIFKNYNKKLKGNEDGLVLYYPFDNDETSSILDKTGNNTGIGTDIEYIKNDGIIFTQAILYSNGKYYSINEENYNQEIKMYNEITDLTKENFDNYSFNPSSLYTETSIGSETFKPISKFGDYKLISLDRLKANINAIKTTKQLFIGSGDFSTRLVDHIDYFKFQYNIPDEDCFIKVAISKDSGKSWYSYIDDAWAKLTNATELKSYKSLTDEEKTQWNKLLDEVLEKGINIKDVTDSLDFNILNLEQARFAYVIQIQDANSEAILKDLKWQFDSIGKYTQLNPKTEVNISMTNNTISIQPLKDIELMKINVGISSQVPQQFDTSGLLDKDTFQGNDVDSVKKADKAKSLEISKSQFNGSRMYYGTDNNDGETKLRNFPAGTVSEHIDTYTFDNLTKGVPQTIPFVKERPEINVLPLAFKYIEGEKNQEEVLEKYSNDNISIKKNTVECVEDALQIKDEYMLKSTLNDDGYYETTVINVDEFLDMTAISEVSE